MHSDIVIIGSGFAAYQVIKSLRRLGSDASIRVLTSDEGHDYNKPDLSHAFSTQQSVEGLITLTAEEFAEKHHVKIMSEHRVESIDTERKTISANESQFTYSKLILATGAKTYRPPISIVDTSDVYSLNSLAEFKQAKLAIETSQSVNIVGGGLIGVELALDLALAGKQVSIIEPSPRLLPSLLPDYVESKLRNNLEQQGVQVFTRRSVTEIKGEMGHQQLALSNGQTLQGDATLLCTGLRPSIELANSIGANTAKGIVVNEHMRTSVKDVYAIGDCVEFDGQLKAFLQPIVVSATVLAKHLMGQQATLALPAMMVKVKTPTYPIQLAGETADNAVSKWCYESTENGLVSKAYSADNRLIGFVVSGDKVDHAFTLFRELMVA